MRVTRSGPEVTLTLAPGESELLTLALKRATFEDTPADRQSEILDFALTALRLLEESPTP